MSAPAPVLARDPTDLPEEFSRGADIPENLDPLAEGVLMAHQAEWLADESDLKLAEKGRRTGVTFAEALDHTLIAAKKKSAGGQNCFYIGDTKDKGREFIGYAAHFAKTVASDLGRIEEFLFEDQKADGSTNLIAGYRIRFASGNRIEALSSRPENIRGLQGVVCIDEAAFHKDVRAVLDAVNALLIWGGKIRVISTHNGVLNPFNELIREALAGKIPYKVHHIPFAKAVSNGLYRRVCLIAGKTWSAEAEVEWEQKIRAAYGPRTAAMRQELDAIPAEAEGAALTRMQIEACMAQPGAIPVIRWSLPDEFKNFPEHIRKAECLTFCEQQLLPVLEKLDVRRPHYLGQDFARSGDVSCIQVCATDALLTRQVKLQLEMRNVPFDQQREVLFYVGDRLPRFSGGALDAAGNGAYLAEKAVQRWGERILEIKANVEWYRVNGAAYVEAFSDRTILLARDDDTLRDHQALAYVGGVIKVPDDARFKGLDGLERHGDSAIAGMLMFCASRQGAVEYGYTPATADPAPGRFLFPELDLGGRELW